MRLLLVAAFVASCSADLLSLRQRAPQSAYSASGADFLSSPRNTYIPPQTSYQVPQNNYLPPQNNYLPPQQPTKPSNVYIPPQNTYIPPQNTYIPPQRPQNTYIPPQKPQNTYIPPQKPQTPYNPPQNNYLPPSGPSTPPVPILKQTNELNEDGSYKYEFITGDQTHVEQMGHIENVGTDHEEQVMHGSYSYVGNDGKTYTVTYVADANGFRAFGDHLPTPPPIPKEIQESLEKNAAEEAAQASHGYPSGQPQGYPSGKPQQQYLPPNKPSFNPQSGYQY